MRSQRRTRSSSNGDPTAGESAEGVQRLPQEESPGSAPDASDADVAEQERAVEYTEDDYRE